MTDKSDWENLYNRIRLNVISWGGQAHGYLNSLDSKPAKEIAANLDDALHALVDLELGAGVPPTQDELKAAHDEGLEKAALLILARCHCMAQREDGCEDCEQRAKAIRGLRYSGEAK